MRAVLRVFVIGLVPALGAAQTALPNSAATQMVRAAGMPLNDGALAPGILTVRVVEGASPGISPIRSSRSKLPGARLNPRAPDRTDAPSSPTCRSVPECVRGPPLMARAWSPTASTCRSRAECESCWLRARMRDRR